MAKKKEKSNIPIRVLIVDDDEAHAQTVAESLAVVGSDCQVANSGKKGAALIEAENFDVIITDMQMDDIDGLGILQRAKEELPEAEVIIVTGHGSINSAVTAMQHGAYTYLPKPLDIHELRGAVEKASTRVRLIRKNAELRRQLDEKFGFEGVIGNSPAMKKVMDVLKQVAPTEATVMIRGDNGTGKELVARAIHQNSSRKSKPFVPVNISALPESTLESELFGHEAGAFTGAIGRRIGKFEYANGGTLFLDEVGEMPHDTQIKLLRVLEDRKITRLGSNEEVSVNVRIVSATNADIEELIERKKFRIDLYHRLDVVTIELPPLQDRKSDLMLLAEHFLIELKERTGKEAQGLSKAAKQAMLAYNWPGNIRQLRNVIERMLVLDTDGLLDVDDLPKDIAMLVRPEDEQKSILAGSGADGLIGQPISDVEKYYIERALELSEGKRDEAAKMLGIGERTLYRKIKEYGL